MRAGAQSVSLGNAESYDMEKAFDLFGYFRFSYILKLKTGVEKPC